MSLLTRIKRAMQRDAVARIRRAMRRQTAREQLEELRAVVPPPPPVDGPIVTREEFRALFPDDEAQPPPIDDGSQLPTAGLTEES